MNSYGYINNMADDDDTNNAINAFHSLFYVYKVYGELILQFLWLILRYLVGNLCIKNQNSTITIFDKIIGSNLKLCTIN